jgi:hypothetical protein
MIEPIIIRHFPDIADAQQDLAASLERVVIIADKKEQSELVARLTANLQEAIAAVLKGNARGPTADADPVNVSRAATEQIAHSVAELTAGQAQMTREITKMQAVEQYVLYKSAEPP